MIPNEQLQQDKICLQVQDQPVEYCSTLSNQATSPTKLSILAQSNTLSLYATITDTVVGIVWCLLSGSICDKHKQLRKVFLVLAPLQQFLVHGSKLINSVFFYQLGVNSLIFSYIAPAVVGSLHAGMTISFSHIAATSTEMNRSLKFFALEVSFAAGLSIGSLTSGQILGLKSWIRGSEIRNYSGAYMIGAMSALCAMLWIYFVVDMSGKQEEKEKDVELNANKSVDEKGEEGKELEKECETKFSEIVKEMLNLKEIFNSFRNALSNHSKPKRHQIIILMTIILVVQLDQLGTFKILFSFTQRVYNWDFEMFSYISTIALLTGPLITIVIMPTLTKVFKLVDIETALIGTVSLLFASISIGSILSSFGFYIKIMFGALANMLNPSVRSKMSKVINQSESTKIFAAMTIMEVLCPFLGAIIYTNIFNATMSLYPSLIFQISGVTLLIPFMLLILLEFKYEREFVLKESKC